MRYLNAILVITLFAAPLALAKPVAEKEDDATFRSPGKPSFPLQLVIDVDASELRSGEQVDGHLRVRTGRPVRDIQLVFHSSEGLRAASDGVAERSVARLDAGDSLTLPIRVEALRDRGHELVVELRAIDPHGRLMSRLLTVDLDKSSVPRNKPVAKTEPVERTTSRGEAVVEAEQEIVRGH